MSVIVSAIQRVFVFGVWTFSNASKKFFKRFEQEFDTALSIITIRMIFWIVAAAFS